MTNKLSSLLCNIEIDILPNSLATSITQILRIALQIPEHMFNINVMWISYAFRYNF